MLLLRWYLARENRRRDREQEQRKPQTRGSEMHCFRTTVNAEEREIQLGNGEDIEKEDVEIDEIFVAHHHGEALGKVDKTFLDLTDRNNRDFRYVY